MKVTRGYVGGAARPYPVATIGNFDGHHLGHRQLLATVVETARRQAGTAMVLTFDPHPVKILAPQADLKFLTSPAEKLRYFESAGIDEVVLLEFTPSFASLSAESFAADVLHRGLGIRQIFVGRHFAFGKGRAGTVADLERLGRDYGFTVDSIEPVMADGEVVSSTRVRKLVQGGRLAEAGRLLGRHYGLEGVVMPGAQRGQTLGWPTANLRLPVDRVIPPDGVYATMTRWRERLYDSVSYIGTRPTFDAGERGLEVYLLDERCELYGEQIGVLFLDRLRGDVQFADGAALSRQIALDVERARSLARTYREGQPAG